MTASGLAVAPDSQYSLQTIGAGWSSPVARQAHNLKVVGSNPTPATNDIRDASAGSAAEVFVFGVRVPRSSAVPSRNQ